MIVYMVISLVILAVGIYLAREKRNDFKMLSLIMTLAIGLAVGVLVIPFFQLSNPNFFFTLLASFRYGSQTIGMNVNSSIADTLDLSEPLSSFYKCFLYGLYIAGPGFASMFLLSFSSTLIEMFRFGFCKKVFVFSELNERSIAIAESLYEYKNNDRNEEKEYIDYHRSLRVFCSSDSAPEALKTRARACHALLLKRDESKIALSSRRDYEFFEIDTDPDKTLNGTTDLVSMLKDHAKEPSRIMVRVFVKQSQIEVVRDLDNRIAELCPSLRVRFVDDTQSEAVSLLNTLRERLPIGEKNYHFNLMIIGCGIGGSAILRTAAWLFTLPESSYTIHVFDKEAKAAASAIKKQDPEFLNAPLDRYMNPDPAGKNYDIVFHEAAAESEAFVREVEALPDMDLVFVTLGDDSLNHTVVRLLQRIFASRSDSLRIPLIAARIREDNFRKLVHKDGNEDKKIRVAENGAVKKAEDRKYDIDDFTVYYGSFKENYSYKNLIQPDLEKAAFRVHMAYFGNPTKEEDKKYAASKFYRHENLNSSFAQALATAARKQYILHSKPENKDEESWIKETLANEAKLKMLGDAEHERWNAYQRVIGWQRATLEQAEEIARRTHGAQVKDDRLLLHPAIVPVEELPFVEEQVDDIYRRNNRAKRSRYVQVDRDIVKELPNIIPSKM